MILAVVVTKEYKLHGHGLLGPIVVVITTSPERLGKWLIGLQV